MSSHCLTVVTTPGTTMVFFCTITFVPTGAISVVLKSNAPSIWKKAESFGLILDLRRRLRAIMHCGTSLYHISRGKLGSVPHKFEMKWFFHVRMVHSAALRQWIPAGVNWKPTPFSIRKSFSITEA